MRFQIVLPLCVSISASLFLTGCSGGKDAPKTASNKPAANSGTESDAAATDSSDGEATGKRKRKKIQPVQIGADATQTATTGTSAITSTSAASGVELSGEQRTKAVVKELQPFQVLLGKWKFVTNKKFAGFAKSGETDEWIWDFRTDRSQPALTLSSDKNPYFTQVWLTYLPGEDKFRLTTTLDGGDKHVLEGTWVEGGEPMDVIIDSKKPDRVYKLLLTQVVPADGDQWQILMNQQENNRYLFELKRKPAGGSAFGPLDIVAQQRMGTSFAVADSDNPGPKCIVSGGLGSSTVSYKGKSYPVCCSGCAAAFNDEPERWIAKFEASEAAKKKD